MPFKSEAQRRYLWANEPKIARDWADTYGSKIHAANGGIMRVGLKNGSNDGPGPGGQGARGQATQNPGVGGRSAPPGRDPRGPHRGMHYQKPKQPSHVGDTTLQSNIEKIGAPPGMNTGATHIPQQQSNFGIGNIFRGALGMFGGVPGQIASFASGLGDQMFQGRGDYKNQAAWEQAKQNRINQKRIANMLKRKGLGKDYGEQNLYDLSGGQYDFRENQFGENQAGITGIDTGIDETEEFDFGELIKKKDKTVADNIDWENEYDFTDKRLPPSHPDYWKKQDIDYGWKEGESLPTTHPDYFTRKNRGYGYIEDYKDPNDPFHVQREDYPKTQWVDTHNRTDRGSLPIEYYYPLGSKDKTGLETIDINEKIIDDVPSDTDISNKRFVSIKDMSTAQIKDFNALDRRDKMEKSGIEIPDPLNDEEKQRLENLRNLRNSQAIKEPTSYTV